MLEKGSVPEAGDLLTAEQEIKDPLVLEFLGLKDEYSETDLENALIEHLETRQVHACRCRSNDVVSRICSRALDPPYIGSKVVG